MTEITTMKRLLHLTFLLVIVWSSFPRGAAFTFAQGDVTTPFITDLEWSPDGGQLAIGYSDGAIQILDIGTNVTRSLPTEHSDQISALAWHPSDGRLASGSFDSRVVVWDSETGNSLAILDQLRDVITAIIWLPDAQRIAASQFGLQGAYWTSDDYSFIGEDKIGSNVQYAANSSQSAFAVAKLGGLEVITSITLNVINRIIIENGKGYYVVAWSPDEIEVVAGTEDGAVRVWDLASNTYRLELRATAASEYDWAVTAVKYVGYHANGTQIASLAADGTFRVWESATGQLISSQDIASSPIYAAALSPDGTTLAYGGETGIVTFTEMASLLPTPTATPTPTLTPSPTVTPSPTPIPCPSNSACFTVGNFRAVQYTGDPRVYIERSMAAGIDPFDSPPTDGWTLIGRTNGAGDNGVLRAFTVINNVPYAALQHPTKGCIVVTPRSLGPRTQGQTRLVNIIEQGNSARCNGDWSGLGG
jgi:WD40 repeat protein